MLVVASNVYLAYKVHFRNNLTGFGYLTRPNLFNNNVPLIAVEATNSVEDVDMILAMGFSTALGLPPQGSTRLKSSEQIQLQGVRIFQNYLFDRQIRSCERGEQVNVYRLPKEHNYGFFSQVHGIAHSLLDAVAHSYVLSWSKS